MKCIGNLRLSGCTVLTNNRYKQHEQHVCGIDSVIKFWRFGPLPNIAWGASPNLGTNEDPKQRGDLSEVEDSREASKWKPSEPITTTFLAASVLSLHGRSVNRSTGSL